MKPIKRLLLLTLAACVLWCGAAAPARAVNPWFFVVVDARVHQTAVPVSDEHPQERRWYVSNAVPVPEGEELAAMPKEFGAYFDANVVAAAAKHGVAVEYYDQDVQMDGGGDQTATTQADVEANRLKDIESRKAQGGNVYTFNLALGAANGGATSQPKLVFRDKAQASYDGSTPAVTTRPVAVTPAADTAPPAAALPTAPQILKGTVALRADRMMRYWKQPDTDNYWSWVPTGAFYVVGPLDTGSKFEIDFTLPDGKPWTTVTAHLEPLAPGAICMVSIPGADSHMDKRGILETGTFGYKIRLRNELTGINQTMLAGKFHVAKLHHGNALPAFKNQFEYYVDQDWNLPVGYLWLDWFKDPNAPMLHVAMWFKGLSANGQGLDDTKLAAYVFYKGKQIASTKTQGGAYKAWSLLTNSSADNDPRWERWEFSWGTVRGWNTDTTGNNWGDTHFLANNPGDYEVRVLRDGDLARSVKFTVGADGKIVDNGLTASNNIGGIAMIVPVKIIGAGDGKWDANAWKTDAFYGNPLKGFTAP